jgi:hypothetical protein
MRHPSKLNRAIASAVLAGSFALAGPSLGSAQELDPELYSFAPAYVPAEPDKTMLKVICTALLRTEIAEELGVEENFELTAELKGAEYIGGVDECEPVVEACPDCAEEESFEAIVVEE